VTDLPEFLLGLFSKFQIYNKTAKNNISVIKNFQFITQVRAIDFTYNLKQQK